MTLREPSATDRMLTDWLAVNVMGWRPQRDRFITGARNWTPRWRFTPLARLDDALALLDRAAATYRLSNDGVFTAEVHVGANVGKRTDPDKPRAITLALAAALGFHCPAPSCQTSEANR